MKTDLRHFSTRMTRFLIVAVLSAIASIVSADVLNLKDGNVLDGTFVGSDGKTIRFETSLGQLTVEKAKIASIAFGDQVAAPTTPATPATTPAATPLAAVRRECESALV